MKTIKECDLVVLDDVGAELGTIDTLEQARGFNYDLMSEITEARQNKNTIMTTNLTSKQLIQNYGDRIVSRLFSKSSRETMIAFKNTPDGRLQF